MTTLEIVGILIIGTISTAIGVGAVVELSNIIREYIRSCREHTVE